MFVFVFVLNVCLCVYVCESVCYFIGALALLTQHRDLKFAGNVKNIPILYTFFQTFKSCLILPLKTKSVFLFEHIKRLNIIRKRSHFLCIRMISRLIVIANKQHQRVLESSNCGSKMEKKNKKKKKKKKKIKSCTAV